jgi:hypothetical protein
VFFGSRAEALAEARQRIEKNPGRYWQDRIWGEHEVGGTGVLYLSDNDLSWMAVNGEPLEDEPFPHRTERILTTVPPTFFAVGLLMTGTWWFARRRQQVMEAEAAAESGKPTQSGEGDGR